MSKRPQHRPRELSSGRSLTVAALILLDRPECLTQKTNASGAFSAAGNRMLKPLPILSTCVFLLLATVAGQGKDDWKTAAPITYNIDYSDGHVGSAEYLKKIQDAPPQLMHVGEDVAFSSVYGTKDGYAGNRATNLAPEEVRAKIAELKTYVASLHAAGVEWVIPYINNKAVIGDPLKRTGYWGFFDNWDRYAEFGFGRRPDEDMLRAHMHFPFEFPRRVKGEHSIAPYQVFEMCGNNPNWRRFLLAVTANIARCGYDGTFVDEMVLRDYCQHDEARFRTYLARKYSERQRRRRFGRGELDSLRLGYPGEGALWYDTQAFWAESDAELLRDIRDEGRKSNASFFVIPNYGPFAHFDGVYKRAPSGFNAGVWAPYCQIIMFEEMQRPGQLAEDLFIDYILQYKMAFALRFRGGVLSYLATEPVGIELGMAEAAAGGGGALIQPHYGAPDSRRKFRQFFRDHAELFDGFQSQADVAVVFDYNQLYWDNRTHLQDIYRLSQYLSEQHILFDLVPLGEVSRARLARYRAVLTPDLTYLPKAVLDELGTYSGSGGLWLDIGRAGWFDEDGHLRTSAGRTKVLRREKLNQVVRYPRFAPYLLRENDNNDINEIVALRQATLNGENLIPPSRDTEDLTKLLETQTHSPLATVARPGLEGLRVNAWQKAGAAGEKVVAHFVNYYCPIPVKSPGDKSHPPGGESPSQYAPKPLLDVPVRLRIGGGKVASVKLFDPDSSIATPVEFQQDGSQVRFVLPEVRIYRIAELTVNSAICRR